MSVTPTSKASVMATDPTEVELATRTANVPANIGVMVESALALRMRLA
jgi:hypothetical protein